MGQTSRTHHRDEIGRGTASRGSSLRKQEEPLRGPKEKGIGKGKRKGRRQGESHARTHHRDKIGRGTAIRGNSHRKQEEPLRAPRGRAEVIERPQMMRVRRDWTPREVVLL